MSRPEPTPLQTARRGAFDSALPGEQELAAEFFVSRNTIREALSVLKDEGHQLDRAG